MKERMAGREWEGSGSKDEHARGWTLHETFHENIYVVSYKKLWVI